MYVEFESCVLLLVAACVLCAVVVVLRLRLLLLVMVVTVVLLLLLLALRFGQGRRGPVVLPRGRRKLRSQWKAGT